VPEYPNFPELFQAARQHVQETRHSVYCCDDPRDRTIGFACSDCTNTETIWVIALRSLLATIEQDDPLWNSLRSLAGRMQLVNELNKGAPQPPPVSFNDWDREVIRANHLSPEEEVSQLESLWDEEGATTAIAVQTRRQIHDKEEYEARVHAKVPTRFERKDVI